VRRGFTLAEMLIVIVILGITAAAVVPAIARTVTVDEVTQVTRRIELILNAARTRALEQATSIAVTLAPESGRYWVRDRDRVLDSGTIALDPGVTLWSTAVRPNVLFSSLGSAQGDSIFVRGPTGAAAIRLDPWTGVLHAAAR